MGHHAGGGRFSVVKSVSIQMELIIQGHPGQLVEVPGTSPTCRGLVGGRPGQGRLGSTPSHDAGSAGPRKWAGHGPPSPDGRASLPGCGSVEVEHAEEGPGSARRRRTYSWQRSSACSSQAALRQAAGPARRAPGRGAGSSRRCRDARRPRRCRGRSWREGSQRRESTARDPGSPIILDGRLLPVRLVEPHFLASLAACWQRSTQSAGFTVEGCTQQLAKVGSTPRSFNAYVRICFFCVVGILILHACTRRRWEDLTSNNGALDPLATAARSHDLHLT